MNEMPSSGFRGEDRGDAATMATGLAGVAVGVVGLGIVFLVAFSFLARLGGEPSGTGVPVVVGALPAVPVATRPEPAVDAPPADAALRQEVERLLQENATLRQRLGLVIGEPSVLEVVRSLEQDQQALVAQLAKVNRQLNAVYRARSLLLGEIRQALTALGIDSHTVEESGRLSLPGAMEFSSGLSELDRDQESVVVQLAGVLARILPCYVPQESKSVGCGSPPPVLLDGIHVEGHTDNVPVRLTKFQDNWSLSSMRAARVLRLLLQASPVLDSLRNPFGESLLRVGGYADRRPVDQNDSAEGRGKNRRVEIRFLMAFFP